ncbi:GNAT family N-acetyltransferase [Paenibacillaceae bacterium]|nr:GNAT family N-acetyltransferase [Paenibacillaceae bacterium]
MTNEIRIVEYAPEYARSLAEMWNLSRDSWGGGGPMRTEQTIIAEHESASLLNVFLAVDGKEVVGYCSYSKYPNAEQTMYIPLLNVRPDYHSKKIGKSLILRAVQETVTRGYPYLDLFTWAGNTKAVPMYKKCGFFWEKSDNYTHMMNFMPLLLQMEALQPYFDQLDWYVDGTRELAVKPDGEEHAGFDLLTYTWANRGQAMRIDFEKSARGINRVETDDFLITTEIEHHELVFGSRYKVRYEIVNKSGKPLHYKMTGSDDKEIQFTAEAQGEVSERTVVEEQFVVNQPASPYSQWDIRPAVTSEWLINGRKLLLRTGITPKKPLKLRLQKSQHRSVIGVPNQLTLSLENQYREPAAFTITFEENSLLTLPRHSFQVSLPASGRCTVPIDYSLQQFGFYNASIKVEAACGQAEALSFSEKAHVLLKGYSGIYGGETEDEWFVANGAYSLHLYKKNNDFRMNYFDQGSPVSWGCPKLGKPYSQEFSTKQAAHVEWVQDNETIQLKAVYHSEDFPGVELTLITKLQANGFVQRHYEIERGQHAEQSPLYLQQPLYCSLTNSILPLNDKIIEAGNRSSAEEAVWKAQNFSENWLFINSEKLPVGVCWHSGVKLIDTNYSFSIEYSIGNVASGERAVLPPMHVAFGTYTDWLEFRSFATGKQDNPVRPALTAPIELVIGNEGNPFVQGAVTVTLLKHDTAPFAGEVEVSSRQERFAPLRLQCEESDGINKAGFEIAGYRYGQEAAIDLVTARYRSTSTLTEYTKAVFPRSAAAVEQIRYPHESGQLLAVDNGVVKIAADPSFGNVFHSLTYKGREWLSSSYPVPGPMLWWNPWHGGIGIEINGLSARNLYEESREAEFVELTDGFGNTWSGIRIRTTVQQHQDYRGLTIEQYALLQPGTAVVCGWNRLINKTGKALYNEGVSAAAYVLPDDRHDESWVSGKDKDIFCCGAGQGGYQGDGVIRFGSHRSEDRLHIVNHPARSEGAMYSNNTVIGYYCKQALWLSDGESLTLEPQFYVFHNQDLKIAELNGLNGISFRLNDQ